MRCADMEAMTMGTWKAHKFLHICTIENFQLGIQHESALTTRFYIFILFHIIIHFFLWVCVQRKGTEKYRNCRFYDKAFFLWMKENIFNNLIGEWHSAVNLILNEISRHHHFLCLCKCEISLCPCEWGKKRKNVVEGIQLCHIKVHVEAKKKRAF